MERASQNFETGDTMNNEKLNQKEESIHSEHQSVFNDSVSDIAEEKDNESGPEDLSIVSH